MEGHQPVSLPAQTGYGGEATYAHYGGQTTQSAMDSSTIQGTSRQTYHDMSRAYNPTSLASPDSIQQEMMTYANAATAAGAPAGPLPEVSEQQVELDKKQIYNHPLFPLLNLIFEKCEVATSTNREPNSENDVCSSESFNEDINVFAKKAQAEKRCFTANPALDSFMVEAIQIFRLHLLEIGKVHELCDNFCAKYVVNLKGKMPMDLMMEDQDSEGGDGRRPSTASIDSLLEPRSPHIDPVRPPSLHSGLSQYQPPSHTTTSPSTMMPSIPPQNQMMTSRVEDLTTQQQPTQNLHDMTVRPAGSTPLHHTDGLEEEGSETGDGIDNSIGSGDGTNDEDGEISGKQRQKKRGIFPKQATTAMRNWLFQHLNHPYPSEEQKKTLAEQTGLKILQVNNWFINARRRIVQPMIDQNNRGNRNHEQYMPDPSRLGSYMHSPAAPTTAIPMSGSYSPQTPHMAAPYALGPTSHMPQMLLPPHHSVMEGYGNMAVMHGSGIQDIHAG